MDLDIIAYLLLVDGLACVFIVITAGIMGVSKMGLRVAEAVTLAYLLMVMATLIVIFSMVPGVI